MLLANFVDFSEDERATALNTRYLIISFITKDN